MEIYRHGGAAKGDRTQYAALFPQQELIRLCQVERHGQRQAWIGLPTEADQQRQPSQHPPGIGGKVQESIATSLFSERRQVTEHTGGLGKPGMKVSGFARFQGGDTERTQTDWIGAPHRCWTEQELVPKDERAFCQGGGQGLVVIASLGEKHVEPDHSRLCLGDTFAEFGDPMAGPGPMAVPFQASLVEMDDQKTVGGTTVGVHLKQVVVDSGV